MIKKVALFLILVASMLFSSCLEREKYPIEPNITELVSFVAMKDGLTGAPKGRLTFRFTDGDGDVGLAPGDTMSPFNRGSEYYYNFFVEYYERQNGELVLLDPPAPLHSRIPRLSNNVPESIEVELSIDIDINPISPYDTIQLKFYLVDRALHKSNVITTPEYIIYK